MTPENKETLMMLTEDFPFYALKCLKIRSKKAINVDGQLSKIIPFVLNRAQSYIHERIEEQKKRFGYVRVLLLKGRQQGCSTYVEGRFYHRTSQGFGLKTFILTHEDKATANLFKMSKRFYDNSPKALRPHVALSNAKELFFDKLDSAYGVGTAGSGDVGRSDTIDFFHGSEVGFWGNTDSIKTGVMQAAEGAEEIILESTANGLGNMFHKMWQDAEKKNGKYIAIFVPWFWQNEYRTKLPDDEKFVPSIEEAAYQKAYKLDDEQIYWRRLKIIELGDPLLFKQEYPGNAAEAFQTTGINSLISAESVLVARKTMGVPKYGAYVVGCDPAREGDDATTFIRRQGRRAWNIESHHKLDDMAKAGQARMILDNEPVDRMFIDRGGGSGMYDRLVEMGYRKRVSLVNFGSNAMDKEHYKNRRAEMWDEARKWLESEEEVQIPDVDTLQADLCAPGFKYTSTTQKQLEAKVDIKKRIGRSPDEGDAFALTFAEPVQVVKTSIKRRRSSGMAA